MKRRNHSTDHHELFSGELYLFHRIDRSCSSTGSLFGIFDKIADGIIYLESSSSDLIHFHLWHCLPDDYCCCRRASRRELRDYIFNLAYYECAAMQSSIGRTHYAARKIESCTHL